MVTGKNTFTKELQLKREEMSYSCSICLTNSQFSESESTNILHQEELKLLNDRQTSKRKEEILLGKYVAKSAFLHATKHPSVQMTDFHIKKGTFEHPVLYTAFAHQHQLTVSHSKSFGASICFPEAHPMGIDIEALEKIKPKVISTKCTQQELELLEQHLGSNHLAAAYLWTAKEALSKCIKTGLMVDFCLLEVSSIENIQEGVSEVRFSNFYQYKGLLFHSEEIACAIVLPKKTTLDLSPLLSELTF